MRQLYLPFSARSNFYNSREWMELRFKTLVERGRKCECCGAARDVLLQVDHVVPISVDPSRKLDPTNLQVLCYHCNHGKSVLVADFRKRRPANDECYQEYSSLVPAGAGS